MEKGQTQEDGLPGPKGREETCGFMEEHPLSTAGSASDAAWMLWLRHACCYSLRQECRSRWLYASPLLVLLTRYGLFSALLLVGCARLTAPYLLGSLRKPPLSSPPLAQSTSAEVAQTLRGVVIQAVDLRCQARSPHTWQLDHPRSRISSKISMDARFRGEPYLD